jgi:hypothetical protein
MMKKVIIRIIILIMCFTSICFAEKRVTYLTYQGVAVSKSTKTNVFKVIKTVYCDKVIAYDTYLELYNYTGKYNNTNLILIIRSEYIVVEDVKIKPNK